MHLTIKKKIIIATLLSVLVSTSAIGGLILKSYRDEAKLAGLEQIKIAKENFAHLVESDVNMMSATMNALMENAQLGQLFSQGQRENLYNMASPLYKQLKDRYRITHWYFHTLETENKIFLRVHQPANFGDENKRITYREAIDKKTVASGLELGKTAFALRVVAPYAFQGRMIGYIELGEEIDHFLGTLKKQTGYDYGMVIKKEMLDGQEWAKNREYHNLANNWDALPTTVLVDKTTENEGLFAEPVTIDTLPDEGILLGDVKKGDVQFSKGAFPLYDAGHRKVGAVFVLRDITSAYQAMRFKPLILESRPLIRSFS
ncbi:hypothetical protein GTO89_10215 [Heliobacterium gestii]|uniref:Double Cache domain-containing protein n=1 Tax=Heliomicrobium gestii TaxID=2699 RepID=A0A845LG51_HELGE|nr:cache domain-containing protein [Heliomicrobium gestii]MBM7868217.1 hypothetical protein [Heliomicrobium gestii]MZP43415.1 hypothetical protein [Heliomicrobium gestii]